MLVDVYCHLIDVSLKHVSNTSMLNDILMTLPVIFVHRCVIDARFLPLWRRKVSGEVEVKLTGQVPRGAPCELVNPIAHSS